MAFGWFQPAAYAKSRGRSSRRAGSCGRAVSSRVLRVESLESRSLLSVGLSSLAHPDLIALGADHGAAPLSTAGPTGYTPAQIRHAYGFDKIAFANGAIAGDGSGTTIAIVDAYDNPKIAGDLHQFSVQFGLPDAVFTKVNQYGGTTYPAADAGWSSEIALDVEWAHAIAPKAAILLVEAADATFGNLLAAVDFARHAAGVVAVSMSWGGGDFSGENLYDSYFTTPSGHGGVTFLASSGDSGAPVGYPAISSNVVAVGGTTLRLDSQGNYLSESAWSGSGGGVSAYEAQPAYQRGVVTRALRIAPIPTWPTTPIPTPASRCTTLTTIPSPRPGASGAAPATPRRSGRA